MRIVTRDELCKYPNGTVFAEYTPNTFIGDLHVMTGSNEIDSWNGAISIMPFCVRDKNNNDDKDSVLQSKAPTKKNIHALAELKDISDEMAKKYFRKTCFCGKKCNPTEVAMFYKTQGRMEGEEDNRTVLCQKCLCELNGWSKREYLDKANEFRDGGCNLF